MFPPCIYYIIITGYTRRLAHEDKKKKEKKHDFRRLASKSSDDISYRTQFWLLVPVFTKVTLILKKKPALFVILDERC